MLYKWILGWEYIEALNNTYIFIGYGIYGGFEKDREPWGHVSKSFILFELINISEDFAADYFDHKISWLEKEILEVTICYFKTE